MVNILEWSEDKEEWQKDALRRIAISDSLSADDRQDIQDRVESFCGVQADFDFECLPLTAEHITTSVTEANQNIICGIGPVSNVDRLTEDQELKFSINGLTIIYGENGSGKSGYSRIAKELCHARVKEGLLSDVYGSVAGVVPSVQYKFKTTDAEPVSRTWNAGESAPSELANINVFDSDCANVYIAGHNEIGYLPDEIIVARRYGQLLQYLSGKFTPERDALQTQLRASIASAFGADTPAGQLVALLEIRTPLSSIPSAEVCMETGAWSADDEKELAVLTEQLKSNPTLIANLKRRMSGVLNNLATSAASIHSLLNIEAVGHIVALAKDLEEKNRIANASADELFSNGFLSNTGGEIWRDMYRFARQFAEHSTNKPQSEHFHEGEVCPLCQSDLSDVSAQRLEQFDNFIFGELSKAAQKASEDLSSKITELGRLPITDIRSVNELLKEFADLGETEKAVTVQVVNYFTAAINLKSEILRNYLVSGFHADGLTTSIAETLKAESAKLDTQVAELESRPETSPELARRHAVLTDKKKLSSLMDTVLTRRANLEKYHRLGLCIDQVDTRSTSNFVRQRRQELVTPALRSAIETEIRELNLTHLPLVFDESTARGTSLFEYRLGGSSASKKRILSEGEQRALSLACFIGEIRQIPGNNGVIFDDPVNSLDHMRLRQVADRLVSLASEGRQVIIFTHNLLFFEEIRSIAAEVTPPVPVVTNLVSKQAGGQFGVITVNDLPWIAKKVRERFQSIDAILVAIPDPDSVDPEQYRSAVVNFYAHLRETWERLVEELLLGGVVERYNPGVKTQSLKAVSVTDDDYKKVYFEMKKVSEYSGHDTATGRQVSLPTKDQMRTDLTTLQTYTTELRRRIDDLGAQRRLLEVAPTGQIV